MVERSPCPDGVSQASICVSAAAVALAVVLFIYAPNNTSHTSAFVGSVRFVEETASRDNLCFKINTNIDEPKKYLEQNEIQIERGIVECTGVFGNIKSIYLKKTNGNLIELSNHRITESKPWKI
ncbi:hypothetical protein [Clostridioides difficile]|uniref:hypothetical protein n=1 Tax=Clostridioides difficile TaxID=1496 RepID=UPI001F26DDFA